MSNSMRPWIVFFCVLCASNLSMNEGLAQPTVAQQPQTSHIQLAHVMADKAIELYNEKKWLEAFEAFEKAEGITHSAEFILYMARCQEKQGDLLEAAKLYRRIIAEQPHATAKPGYKRALTNARIAAKEELTQLETRIPTIQVRVQGANGRLHRLTVGGVTSAPIDVPIPVNPEKPFWIVLWDGEGRGVARLRSLPQGIHEEFSIPMPPEDTRAVIVTSAPIIPKNNDGKSDVAWRAFLGITMAGGLTGMGFIIAGVGLNAQASNAWGSCPPLTCSDEQQRAREDLDTSEILSAVGVVTVLGSPLVGGLVATWVWPKKTAPNQIAPKPISLGISPNGFTVKGTF